MMDLFVVLFCLLILGPLIGVGIIMLLLLFSPNFERDEYDDSWRMK